MTRSFKNRVQSTDTKGTSSSNNGVQTLTVSNANGGNFRVAFAGQTTVPYETGLADRALVMVGPERI